MQEPKLPKLELIKRDATKEKILIPLNWRVNLQVDPKYFKFYPDIKSNSATARWGFGSNMIVKEAYKKTRQAFVMSVPKNKAALISDCIALDKYSKLYQQWLKEKNSDVNP